MTMVLQSLKDAYTEAHPLRGRGSAFTVSEPLLARKKKFLAPPPTRSSDARRTNVECALRDGVQLDGNR